MHLHVLSFVVGNLFNGIGLEGVNPPPKNNNIKVFAFAHLKAHK